MAMHVIEEARRCLQCKKPLCRLKGCPIQTNIPEMIRLFLDGKTQEAGQMLFENNPLSIVCSLVCDHEHQCEGNCIQGKRKEGTAVQIPNIEHYISDSYFDRAKVERLPDTGQRVAIIGAGPAGLTIAIKLAALGHRITIFERMDKIGGMMRYGIPAFRLPRIFWTDTKLNCANGEYISAQILRLAARCTWKIYLWTVTTQFLLVRAFGVLTARTAKANLWAMFILQLTTCRILKLTT